MFVNCLEYINKYRALEHRQVQQVLGQGGIGEEKNLPHVSLWFYVRLMKPTHTVAVFTISLKEFSHKIRQSQEEAG